jgi:hypothetical protein
VGGLSVGAIIPVGVKIHNNGTTTTRSARSFSDAAHTSNSTLHAMIKSRKRRTVGSRLG